LSRNQKNQQQFGNDNFYVVIFPAYPMAPELRKAFERAQLNVIDYSTLFSWKAAYDGMHPDGDSYKQVAEKLADDLPIKPGHRHGAL
jgi:lysophospholipase L1-like esterase